MKKFVLLFLLTILFVGCSQEYKTEFVPFFQEECTTKSTSKDIYQVTQKDIRDYVDYLSVHDDYKDNQVISVSTFCKDGHDVFYIINLEEGWKLISADKRGPIILAQSDSGQFDSQSLNEGEKVWFNIIADQIIERKNNSVGTAKMVSKLSTENESRCLDFWKAITGDSAFLVQKFNNKSSLQDVGDLTPSRVYTVEVSYESVDHLIPVYWNQGAPFNLYCPLKNSTSLSRCPAGCGPIAIAQVIYYLHYNIVYHPSYSPSTGSCVGYVGNYSQSFSDFAGFTWGNMSYSDDPNGYAALLIGYIGKETNTIYGPNGSSTLPADMKSIFGSHFGINCKDGQYNEDVVYSNIRLGLPVICVGYSATSGHAFILDGYESSITETHYEYTLPSGNIVESVTLSDPYITSFRINWGWGMSGRNTTYSPSGSWNGYDNNRGIIYNFISENK